MRRTADPRSAAAAPARWHRVGIWLLSALVLSGAALQARAQTPQETDAPDRAARLSEVIGQVWLYNEDADEWIGVARNRPLTTGDRLATDNDARAEVTLGSTTLRLDAATELEIELLDDDRFALHLHRGSVAARVRSASAVPEFEVNTDEGRFRLQAVGRYRFDRFDQASDVTVMSGRAVFEGRGSALAVGAGQHAQFWLDAGGAAQYSMSQSVRDAFASWNDDRDSAEDRVAASRYVSPEMTGAEDLARYGRWEQTTDYGPVWQPTVVPSGWAPYSTGHWAWIRPWGWTWVDDAPWGFAPFHYGRWVYHRDAWRWAPGTYVRRPVYAPALVAWMAGSHGGVSISIGGGGPAVGWFPLAPREVYLPSYWSSSRYVRNINVTHVTNVTVIDNHWRNRHREADRRDFSNRKFPHAVTVVPQSVLTGRQPVAPFAGRLRNDPQVRAMISDGRSLGVTVSAPVARPRFDPPRRAEGRARPPFEGRAPGGFAGRPDTGRVDGRPDARRSEGGRDDRPGLGERPTERAGDRIRERPAERAGDRIGERPAERAGDRIGERPAERAGDRIGERPAERAGDRIGERAGDRIGERPAERRGDRIGDPTDERRGERADRRERPGERTRERVGAPVGVPPAVVSAPTPAPPLGSAPDIAGGAPSARPPRGAFGREPALNDAAGTNRGMASPGQARRGAPPEEAGGRPGLPGRERRAPPDVPNAAPPVRPMEPPRAFQRPSPPPRAAEAQRPAAPAEVQRPTAPAEVQRPAAPPPAREPRMSRPEPQERGEGRPDRRGPSERVR